MVESALSCFQVIPVFWAVHVSKYCSGGFSESVVATWEEYSNIGSAREFKVSALRAAKPVTKSRRVVANCVPQKIQPSHRESSAHCLSSAKNTPLKVNRPDEFIWPVGWNFSELALKTGFSRQTRHFSERSFRRRFRGCRPDNRNRWKCFRRSHTEQPGKDLMCCSGRDMPSG